MFMQKTSLGVGSQNIVLAAPRDGDLRTGVHRLIADACPDLTKPVLKGKNKDVARIAIDYKDAPSVYIYLIYTQGSLGERT